MLFRKEISKKIKVQKNTSMEPAEQLKSVVVEEDYYSENEGSDLEDLSDSQDDPTYDILGETQFGFSDISMQKTEMDLALVEDLDDIEIVAPVLGKKDEKSFEMVQKMIEDGQLDQLKLDQCRVYLRKNGLRLSGCKNTLLERIKEHLDVINGGAEEKYPVSSFVLNCKGDACMGDVVMFKQKVYERFSIVSRSASGPPSGSRIIAGRIVKESYGASKQQHTFTIEVLWSKGAKLLPPLYPLLIKGRNLYRMKTLRQRWKDEREREKVLMEKHSRGYLARSDREARIARKEKWKNKLHLKATRNPKLNRKKLQSNPTKLGLSADSEKLVQSPTQANQSSYQDQHYAQIRRQNLCPNAHGDHPRIAITSQRRDGYVANNHSYGIPLRGMNHIPVVIPSQGGYPIVAPTWVHPQTWRPSNGRVCQHYAKGRCHFGPNCKFLHDLR